MVPLLTSSGVKMDKNSILIGIIGGIGLGILIGCEFCGSTMTIIGGILVLFSIISILYLRMKKNT
jgi:hypothetical protein